MAEEAKEKLNILVWYYKHIATTLNHRRLTESV